MEDNFKYKGKRRILALELKEKGINDQKILNAIENIPRHLFVDPGLSEQAYIDKALPIKKYQTISQPYTVAFQTQLLNLKIGHKILEIGTGSGYQTAILCYLGAETYTMERDHDLFRATSNLLAKMNLKPKKMIYGDGFNGSPNQSPFNGIIVTAGSPVIPKKLINQLNIGGVLIIPLGKDVHVMTRITRVSKNKFKKETFGNFRFVPMLKNKN